MDCRGFWLLNIVGRAELKATTSHKLQTINQLGGACKLPQEPHVIFAEQANVVDAVLEQGGPFDTHPKRKTGVFFGVDITVFKHFRVNHTATQYFEPAGTFTNGATFAVA